MLLNENRLIIYPTSRAIREAIKQKEGENILLPSYITIDEFLKKSITIEDKRFLDEDERFLYLKEACKKENLHKLGLSTDFFSFLKESNFLFRFFGELSAEKIDINELEKFDTYEFYNEHITILKSIYKNYNEILEKENVVDKINLPENYSINKDFINRYDSIEVFYEGYFTNFEFEIIEKISKIVSLKLHFLSTKYNKKSLQHIKDIDFKEECYYKFNLSNMCIEEETVYNSRTENIEISAFINPINQIAFIKVSINKIIKSGIKPEKIAVVLPNENVVETLKLFDTENYFNYAMGNSIKNRVYYKLLNNIYNYLNEDDDFKNEPAVKYYEVDFEIVNSFKNCFIKNVLKEDIERFFNYLKTYENDGELLEKVDEILYTFDNLVFKHNQKLSFKEALKILIQKISSITLDDVNSGVITVMGLLESRAQQFDAVIICDFNESQVPKKSIKDKFLSTSIKKSIGLPTPNDRENLQKYYYSRLINGAKQVYVSYVNSQSEQLSRFTSEIFKDLKFDETPKDKEYSHILYKSKKINHFSGEIEIPYNLSLQEWSASSLKTFLECKRKYFLKYVVGIENHNLSLKPQSFELGNLIHKVLDELYKKSDINDISYERLKGFLEKELIKNPFLLVDKEIYLKKLSTFIELEQSRFSKGLEIIALEKEFKFVHNGIVIKGKIDRIDKVQDEYFIIDYKTSSNLKIDSLKTFENSSDFQLEFYYLAANYIFNTDKIKTFYYDLSEISLKEEVALNEKLKKLDDIFSQMNTKTLNFSKCEKVSECQFCEFKTICDR